MLSLKEKLIKGDKTVYTFLYNNETIALDYKSSVNLIQATAAKDRNCRIINGVISLKTGILPSRYYSTVRKQAVYMYTKQEYISKFEADRRCILSNEAFFSRTEKDIALLKSCEYYIHAIDEAKILDYNTMKMETPFGITDVSEMSTGLKTLLNILYLMRKYKNEQYLVDVDECGDNALKYIYPLVRGSNISLYISHLMAYLPDDFVYVVNDVELKDPMDIIDHMKY